MSLNYLENILFENIKIYSQEEQGKIKKAYNLAKSLHVGQLRKSGEPYIIHPINVALILVSYHADVSVICAGLLHDTIEDTDVTFNQLLSVFDYNVANLVDGVSKIDSTNKSEKMMMTHRKILKYFCNDPRVLIIKFADRLHNMRTIKYLKPLKQEEQAQENFELYIPLSYLLGAYEMKNMLEDLSFQVLFSKEYQSLNDTLYYYKKLHKEKWLLLIEKLETVLRQQGIVLNGNIRFNLKNVYGVFNRIHYAGGLSDIHDLVAFRIICNNEADCYLTLQIIHRLFEVVDEYEKDYIKKPKTNGYQSLHTAVKLDNEYIQFQIRTRQMEIKDVAGIAGYFELYQDRAVDYMQKYLQENNFFYQALKEIEQNIRDNKEFLEAIKNDFLTEKIHVYDNNGRVLELPKGATLVDFAYQIHTDIGNHLVAGRVNGQLVAKDYVLKDNDYIVALTGDVYNPPSIYEAKTNYARSKIKRAINKL